MEKGLLRIYGIFICSIISAVFAYFLSQSNNYTTHELALQTEGILHQKETLAKQKLDQLSEVLKKIKPKQLFSHYHESTSELYNKEGIALYVYQTIVYVFGLIINPRWI